MANSIFELKAGLPPAYSLTSGEYYSDSYGNVYIYDENDEIKFQRVVAGDSLLNEDAPELVIQWLRENPNLERLFLSLAKNHIKNGQEKK